MWQKIANVAALAALLGVSGSNIYGDAYRAHVALAAFVLTCLAIGAYGILAIRRWQLVHYEKGYVPVATFVRYSTTDGKRIVHETYRQIQIKHSYLTKIDHRYLWSGTKAPQLTSSLQKIGVPWRDSETGVDVVEVYFERPRFYNETEIIHLRSTMDDSDEQSQTFVSLLLEHPIKMVHFRIELLHCTKPAHAAMTARIERRLKSAPAAPFEEIETVKFDVTSKCFEHLLANPAPGFHYRLSWDRPQSNGHRNRK